MTRTVLVSLFILGAASLSEASQGAVLKPTTAQGDGCKLVAEISVEAVKTGAFLMCLEGNPVACLVAKAADDAATKGASKSGLENGCKWAVKKLGPKIKIVVESAKDKFTEMAITYEWLNTADGIMWLERRLR